MLLLSIFLWSVISWRHTIGFRKRKPIVMKVIHYFLCWDRCCSNNTNLKKSTSKGRKLYFGSIQTRERQLTVSHHIPTYRDLCKHGIWVNHDVVGRGNATVTLPIRPVHFPSSRVHLKMQIWLLHPVLENDKLSCKNTLKGYVKC